MPLLDHFRSPLLDDPPWSSLAMMWAAALVSHLNRLLPRDDFRAYGHVHLGSEVEADIAEFKSSHPPGSDSGKNGGVALQTYAPPTTALSMPATFPDEFEVQVLEIRDSRRLVAVIEIVSLANKKEAAERQAFAAKCAAYLSRGIGLVVVDAVSARRVNLHDDLARLMGLAEPFIFPPETSTYAVAYRPVRRGRKKLIDFWPFPLRVGVELPTVPLALKAAFIVPLDLEATYSDACRNSGVG